MISISGTYKNKSNAYFVCTCGKNNRFIARLLKQLIYCLTDERSMDGVCELVSVWVKEGWGNVRVRFIEENKNAKTKLK